MSDPSNPSPPTNDRADTAPIAAARRSVDMRYINVLASLLAVFVSLLSLWLAYSSNRTQERMFAASSWPYLRFGSGNVGDDGALVIRMMVHNGGSGPAVLRWLRLEGDGRPLPDASALIHWASPESTNVATQTASTTDFALAPGGFLHVMQLQLDDTNRAVWNDLDEARGRLKAEGCYCSLIDDCWLFAHEGQPEAVDACPAAPDDAWRG